VSKTHFIFNKKLHLQNSKKTVMEKCWICKINEANSGEHKFKASDIKKNFGKKNIDALYINQDIVEINKYKDDKLKFEKLICIPCNEKNTRPHDDAYDIFIEYCNANHNQLLKSANINFENIYGGNWRTEKSNLYKYFAKHAGCKIKTLNQKIDINSLSDFIVNKNETKDFIIKFEFKESIELLIKHLKHYHLLNSQTTYWHNGESLKFGGWTTNNYLTINWIYGININEKSNLIENEVNEGILLTNADFIESINDIDEREFSKAEFVFNLEYGENKTIEDRAFFFEKLIAEN
jgi:hypothetical protein